MQTSSAARARRTQIGRRLLAAELLLALALLPATVGLLAGCSPTGTAQPTAEPTLAPVAASAEAIVAEAVIEPLRSAELRFQSTGRVAETLIEAGQQAVPGTPLVRLDTAELALSLQSAQQEVAVQRAALDQLSQGASETQVARAARENAQQIAQAEIALRVQQIALEKAQATDPDEAVAEAQAQVDQLKLSLAQIRAQDPAPDVRAAQVELERAQIALDETRDEYNKALDRPWEPQTVRDGWAKQLKQAELNQELAQAQLDRALNTQRAHGVNLAQAQAQVTEAENRLARATATRATYTLTLQTLSAEVDAAQSELAALRAWENPYLDRATAPEIAQAEARLRQAEIAAARLALQVREAELVAPPLDVDGATWTAASVRVEAGDAVAPGDVAVVLGTLALFQARTVDLTELDVARVSTGQRATITVDALPGREFSGVVREIALQGQDYRGDVVYDVTVELDGDPVPDGLRWGMTAVITIETE
jgi:multidrug resistance efflux pump